MSKPLGDLCDELYRLNTQITAANKVVSDLQKTKTELEGTILAALDEQKTTAARGKMANVVIKSSIKPGIADFEALATFILRKKAVHLLQRRISSEAYAELKGTSVKPLPGCSEFLQRTLSVTKVS
jgi:hypothetical protein